MATAPICKRRRWVGAAFRARPNWPFPNGRPVPECSCSARPESSCSIRSSTPSGRRGSAQLPYLRMGQFAPVPLAQIPDTNLPDTRPHQLDDLVFDRLDHPPDLAVAAFGDTDLDL